MKKMSEEAFYESPRLKKAMDKLSSFPLSFLLGGAGYGKSLLARRYLASRPNESLYFLCSGSDLGVQYERFLTLLGNQDAPLANRLRVLGFPQDEWSFLRFNELLRKSLKKKPFYLVIDDAQWLAGNPAFLFFLVAFEQEKFPCLHLLIVSRALLDVPLMSWRLKNEVGCLSGEELALSEEETGEYLRFRGLELGEALVKKIHQQSEGWIAAIELYARGIKERGGLVEHSGIQRLFKEAFYGALKEKERLLLSRLSPFEEFTLPFAIAATGNAEIVPLLQRLAKSNAFTSEEGGFYRFHALFREFLQSECPADEEEKRVYRRAGFYLFERNDPAEPFLIEWFVKGDCVEELFERMNKPDTRRWDFLTTADVADCLAMLKKDAYRDYPYAYLSCLFIFFVWGGSDGFPFAKALYDEMEGYYGDGQHPDIAAELALIKRLFFPERSPDGADPLYRIGNALYPRSTILLRKEDPFTYGLPMLLESEYFTPGALDQDLARLADNAYERVCPGFGRGSEELAKAEVALLRGQFSLVPSLIRQSRDRAKQAQQSSIIVSGLYSLMLRALYLGKIDEAKAHLDEMGEWVSAEASRADLRPVSKNKLLAQYWLSSVFYGAFCHAKEYVSSPGLLGGENAFFLNDGLGVGKVSEALTMYAFEDYAGAYAVASALSLEKNASLLPHLLGLLLSGLSLEHLEGKDEGWPLIKEALLLGEKDRLILPFAAFPELIPFLERFAALSGGDSSYRAQLDHDARYHQSVFPPSEREPLPSLSKREKQLLLYLEEKKSRAEIASLLYIQENTVKSELASLYKKLGVHSRDEALSRSQKK